MRHIALTVILMCTPASQRERKPARHTESFACGWELADKVLRQSFPQHQQEDADLWTKIYFDSLMHSSPTDGDLVVTIIKKKLIDIIEDGVRPSEGSCGSLFKL